MLVAGDRRLRMGDSIGGRITKMLPHVGLLVDIGVGYDVLLPIEHYGKKLKRPRVGYELAYLEVLDVDPEATEEHRRIILGAETCINLTPSPLLITSESKHTASLQSSPCSLTPATSCQASPQLIPLKLSLSQGQLTSPQPGSKHQPQQDPFSESPDTFQLDTHAPLPKASSRSLLCEGDMSIWTVDKNTGAPISQLRQIFLDKAAELGVAGPQLAPVLKSFDALELRMTVLDKAQELGIKESQLAPILRSINDMPNKVEVTSKKHKTTKTPFPTATRGWHNGVRKTWSMAARAA